MRKETIKEQSAKTLDDIAKELKVSKTTISRAISGKGRIGAETRDKVLAYIAEHGYRPNHIAKSLAASKSFNIAVALPTDREVLEIPFFQICLFGITEAVTRRDYDVVLTVTTGEDISGLKRLIRNRKVDGVVLTRPLAHDKAVAYLQERGFPFVVIGSCAVSSIIQIDSDHRSGCKELMQYVLKAGFQRTVLLAGDPEHQVNQDRYAGFLGAYDSLGLQADEGSVCWNMNESAVLDSRLTELMTKKPDCLACMDDVICGQVMLWLRKHGYEVPRDLGVVSFHDSAGMEHLHPAVTALHIDVQALAATAGNTLIDLLEGREIAIRDQVAYAVIIRESTRIV